MCRWVGVASGQCDVGNHGQAFCVSGAKGLGGVEYQGKGGGKGEDGMSLRFWVVISYRFNGRGREGGQGGLLVWNAAYSSQFTN